MTDTTNYRIVAHYEGDHLFDVVHEDENKKCEAVLLTTVNISVQALTSLAHQHSLTCRYHS